MPPLHEETIVRIKLGHVAGAALLLIISFGGWLFSMQMQLETVKTDVAVIREAIAPKAVALK